MDLLPRALDNMLGVLLCDHTVSSWKIAANGPNPTVVLRLRQTHQSQEHGYQYRAQTKLYRTKPPSQVERDRKRAAQFRQRCDLNLDSDKNDIPCDLSENITDINATENPSTGVQNGNTANVYVCSDIHKVPSDIDPHLSREALRLEDTECTGDLDSLAIGGVESDQEMDQQSAKSTEVTGEKWDETGCDTFADDTVHEAVFERDSGSVSLERERSVLESTPRTSIVGCHGFDIDSRGDSSHIELTTRPSRAARGRLSLKRRGRGQENEGGKEGINQKTDTKTTDSPTCPPPSGACLSSNNFGSKSSSKPLSQDDIRAILSKMDEMGWK